MNKGDIIETINFFQGLKRLGFDKDDLLYLTDKTHSNPSITFHIEKAKRFKADAVYLRKQFTGNYIPQVYLFDFTNQGFSNQDEEIIAQIQKQIWSSGEAPLACFFYNTEIKIIDCTTSTTKLEDNTYKPTYLEQLKTSSNVHKLYNEQFAVKIKSGAFWDEIENKNKFKFAKSAYDVLIKWIKKVTEALTDENKDIDKKVINKIIIQSILIKYLEEKIDENNKNLFGDKYFPQFDKAKSFTDVLRKGKFVGLLEKLHTDFNGNLFAWKDEEKSIIAKCDLNILAVALDGNDYPNANGQTTIPFDDIRLYEFNYIPVELISRLYEEFLAGDDSSKDTKQSKQDNGIFYTPSHLARLLVDEAMPLKNYSNIDLNTYRVLDPACGSGIFLVIAFKRLIQWWRLQNEMAKPDIKKLKELIKCVYGTDKEAQATQLAAFSLCLALCDELSPMQIISKLRFDDLTQTNVLYTDFFINELKPKDDKNALLIKIQKTNYEKLSNIKFDLVIGNPPFSRGAIKEYSQIWEYEGEKINIPQGQIALKFLAESFNFLKENGIECLIIKSSGLLYNSSSEKYKKFLFSRLNVIQLFDFSALARNQSLWDNEADVASAAIFLRKATPDFKKNILHVTFRRTKATNERLVFEIDDYDLHFVNRQTAIDNNSIWKCNLLGGGRIKTIIEKYDKLQTFQKYLENHDCYALEGLQIGTKKHLSPPFIYKLPFLQLGNGKKKSISEEGIDYKKLITFNLEAKFSHLPPEELFLAPNLVFWEVIGKNKFPIFLNETSISFNKRVIGIKSRVNDLQVLNAILKSFEEYFIFYKFQFLTNSAESLINRNNTFLLKDLKNIRFIESNKFSDYDINILNDVIYCMSDFFIHGETSKAVKPISRKEIKQVIEDYGSDFSSVLNLMYEEKDKKFHLSEIVSIDNSFIATVFKYDNQGGNEINYSEQKGFDLAGLSHHQVSQHLNANRIIKLYPEKDTIVFVKPNQYRYWISLIAYRDADKCIADLANAGY